MLRYVDSSAGLSADQLDGFFEGWPDAPSPATHLALLESSAHVWLAIETVGAEEAESVVGFITAISDGVLSAFIPLLEVRSSHRGQGIGSELVRRMLATLGDLYAVDVVCDADVQPFYERLGLRAHTAMVRRNYDRQSGA